MKPCRLLLQLLVVSHLTILRFLRLELVNQYFDRRHSTVVYHFHTHWPDWLPGSRLIVSSAAAQPGFTQIQQDALSRCITNETNSLGPAPNY